MCLKRLQPTCCAWRPVRRGRCAASLAARNAEIAAARAMLRVAPLVGSGSGAFCSRAACTSAISSGVVTCRHQRVYDLQFERYSLRGHAAPSGVQQHAICSQVACSSASSCGDIIYNHRRCSCFAS